MKKASPKAIILSEQFKLRGIFVSSYIPRKCGIATYTKDLTNAINILNPDYFAEIMAMDDPREVVDYPWEVKYRIHRNVEQDYITAAQYVNKSSCDYVSLQHEYGIFGGNAGVNINSFVRHLKKPLITTFHTTLEKPSIEEQFVLKRIAHNSKACIVMVPEAEKRLKKIYDVPADKIVVIPHGVPNIPFSPSHLFKKKIGFAEDDFLVGSINLVSPSKGIEYVIEAIAKVKKFHKNVKFLMIGQTHPLVKLHAGEAYRQHIKTLVKKFKLEDNFVEIDRYIELDELIEYLKALDVYITPYLEKSQTSSGTLAYALGAGKVCISTPYIYAKETLKNGRGILITPKSPQSIADALLTVIKNPEERAIIEKKAYEYGRHMIWERVALDYLNVFDFATQ